MKKSYKIEHTSSSFTSNFMKYIQTHVEGKKRPINGSEKENEIEK